MKFPFGIGVIIVLVACVAFVYFVTGHSWVSSVIAGLFMAGGATIGSVLRSGSRNRR